jgi:hypothetical protein
VALLHVAAFSMGYFICKGIGFNEKTCRTVSIETGEFGIKLAALHCLSSISKFPQDKLFSLCVHIIFFM